jgi:tRNA threonylcarbamoyl adenosine modification protein YeaZ
MIILALEFSSPQRSVAAVISPEGGTRQSRRKKSEIGRKLAEFALPDLPVLSTASAVCVSEVVETMRTNTLRPFGMVEEALKQAGLERAQIEVLAVGLGPGSYTGTRAAISVAQGWQLARGVKLLGISSAECVAAQAQRDGIRGRAHVVIDAQRNEFYLAGYELGEDGWRETVPLRLVGLNEARGGLGKAGFEPEQFYGRRKTRADLFTQSGFCQSGNRQAKIARWGLIIPIFPSERCSHSGQICQNTGQG